jgi:hypothetical protein
MQASPEFLFDLLELGPHPLLHRLAEHDELPLAGQPATVREAQEVERLRLAFAPFGLLLVREASEPQQPGLVGVQFQVEPGESLA